MKFFVWLIRILIFIAFLVLALANLQEGSLNLLAGYTWSAPMILIGLVFFVIGALAGLLAALPGWFRRGRELARLRRELQVAREGRDPADLPPFPPIM
ncbi:lipopolysaccharide assembly protein LapA domain-containing protein [Robbsia sp. Bb-Pol-6]|uniref:Lipopolysaccharide assembly protein LapA domain-containing protein n=1 Tax=Robbsia betulipollinis TaxID=2981849 RepID=A0ABT3ZRS8_9BURK|nr:lipopolysaccharide assembly protein LapA domain-containing protein [Robbsia betulipollinis]MCY0388640.1 lipopolysaccharide assembly protein LapA domain-containing protein [Robbsia betulipollinis]